MFLSHVKISLVTAVLAIAVMAGCSDNSFQGKAAKSSTGSGPASGINGLPGSLPSNLPPGCRNVPTEVPRDTVTTLRCTDTANINKLYPPLVAVVGSCPSGKFSVGEITFSRYSSQPIYHVNLGPRPNFPNRGFIYVTVLGSPEILGPDEIPLSGGTYQVTYDRLIQELGISQTIQGSKVECN